jgi:hypothetical protein
VLSNLNANAQHEHFRDDKTPASSPGANKKISCESLYEGLHEVVHHIMPQSSLPVLPALVRRDALLHVNLSYSDSHEIFLLAPGDEADKTRLQVFQLNSFKHDYNRCRLVSILYIKNTNEDDFYQVHTQKSHIL